MQGMIRDRNGNDLTQAEEIKKRWKEYTEELYKKGLKMQITTMVWSLILSQTSWRLAQGEVKWPLGSITTNKASGGDRIPAELSKIPEDDVVKLLHS